MPYFIATLCRPYAGNFMKKIGKMYRIVSVAGKNTRSSGMK